MSYTTMFKKQRIMSLGLLQQLQTLNCKNMFSVAVYKMFACIKKITHTHTHTHTPTHVPHTQNCVWFQNRFFPLLRVTYYHF